MTKEVSANFSEFGKTFQENLICLIMKDKQFADQIQEVLVIKYFEQVYLQRFVEIIFDYKNKYKVHPSTKAIRSILRTELKKEDKLIKNQIVDFFTRQIIDGDVIRHIDDIEYIKDKSIDFCKKQKLYQAMEKSIEILPKSSFEEIRLLINTALNLGLDNNYGHDFIKDFEERYKLRSRFPVSTGWPQIDAITRGGLGAKELGVVIAPTGAGKSHTLAHLGSQGVKAGKQVVHYTLELAAEMTGRRYDACLTHVPLDSLRELKDKVFEEISKFPGALTIKEYPTKTATTQTIRNHLDKLCQRGTKPDMAIVDYADLLRPTTSYKEKRMDLEGIYEDLRAIAGEYQIQVWTACFHGNTRIYQPGKKHNRIKDLVGKSGFPVYSYDFKQKKLVLKTVKKVYKSGKNQKLFKVYLDNGKTVIVTANHSFMLRNGEYKKVKDLKIDDSLMPLKRRMKDGHKQIYCNNGKWEFQHKLVGQWKYNKIPKYHQIHHVKTSKSVKMLWQERTTVEEKRIEDKAAITKFGSTKEDRIQKIIQILTTKEFVNQKDFLDKIKHIPLNKKEKAELYNNKNCKVVKVEFWGVDDVYNMEVEDFHNYGLEAGIIVKNSQTNRGGLNLDVITMESISEAFNKCFVADFIFSISRTIEDRGGNTGRMFIAKSRLGPDGMVYPVLFDPSNVNIKVIDEPDTVTGVETSIKEMADKKLKEFYKQRRDTLTSTGGK